MMVVFLPEIDQITLKAIDAVDRAPGVTLSVQGTQALSETLRDLLQKIIDEREEAITLLFAEQDKPLWRRVLEALR